MTKLTKNTFFVIKDFSFCLTHTHTFCPYLSNPKIYTTFDTQLFIKIKWE